MKAIVFQVALFAFLAVPAPVGALDLRTYLEQVELSNPAIVSARLRQQAQEHRVVPAATLDDPFVAAGPDEIPLGEGMGYVVRYQVSQSIPFPGKLGNRGTLARAQARALEGDADTIRRQVRVAAHQAFFQALYNQRAQELNQANSKSVQGLAESAKVRYETGGGTHHDWLLASIEFNGLQVERLRLEREQINQRTMLNEFLGQASILEIDHYEFTFPEIPAKFELEITGAIAAQPELKTLRAQADASHSEMRQAGLGYYPDFTLQGMAMQSKSPDEMSSFGIMIGLTIPLYAWRKQSELKTAASLEFEATQANRHFLENRLRTEWLQASQQRATAWDTVQYYRTAVIPTTKIALQSSAAGYSGKTAPLAEYLSILRVSQTQELEFLGAQIDAVLADVRLRELLSAAPQVRFAPSAPTLFGGSMGSAMPGSMEAPGSTGMGRGMPVPKPTPGKPAGAGGAGGMKGM